jgi:hypothetical protein
VPFFFLVRSDLLEAANGRARATKNDTPDARAIAIVHHQYASNIENNEKHARGIDRCDISTTLFQFFSCPPRVRHQVAKGIRARANENPSESIRPSTAAVPPNRTNKQDIAAMDIC